MRRTRNEQGYALLIVLLLIVFLTILTAVFLRGSISNARQEKSIDYSHLTVVAAESGVDYYKTKFSNEYFEKIENLQLFAESELEARLIDINGKRRKPITEDYVLVRIEVVGKLKEYLSNLNIGLIKTPITLRANKDKFVFKIDPDRDIVIEITGDYSVRVSGSVLGLSEAGGKRKSLTYEQLFNVPSFDPSVVSEGSNSDKTDDMVIKDWTYPIESQPSKVCPNQEELEGENCYVDKDNGQIIESEDSIVYFPLGYKFKELEIEESRVHINGDLIITSKKNDKDDDDDEELDVEESILAVDGNVKVPGDIEFEDSEVYISKNLTASDDIEIQKSKLVRIGGTLETSKDLKVKKSNLDINTKRTPNHSSSVLGSLDMQDSKFSLYGAFNVKKNFDLKDSGMLVEGSMSVGDPYKYETKFQNGILYVIGSLNLMGKKIELQDDSTICVHGSAAIGPSVSLSKNSRIYYYGSLAFYGSDEDKKKVILVESQQLNQYCKMPVVDQKPVVAKNKWPIPSIDVSYQ
ncbi:hypothetical protein [Sporosarcina sp. A2]|uniref:hypothetical protein n=1 Tax=Sporosarcina sp. A2 TaxID=3393449 RepID=UPI003D78DD74